MIFERTEAGKANERYFYDADLVVYGEGSCDNRVDEEFWKLMFRKVLKVKIKYKALGGKKTVIKKARAIALNRSKGVVAVLDRDYDDLFGRFIDDVNVIYTHGYSIESDILRFIKVDWIAKKLCRAISWKKCRSEFEDFRLRIQLQARRLLLLDIAYLNEEVMLYNRKAPNSIITSTHPPMLNCKNLIAKIRPHRRSRRFSIVDAKWLSRDHPLFLFHGKVSLCLATAWLRNHIKLIDKSISFSEGSFFQIAMSEIAQRSQTQLKDLFSYYRPKLTQVRR